jgi:tripartite-type tricarboxylate transporter receptor subunit TctC
MGVIGRRHRRQALSSGAAGEALASECVVENAAAPSSKTVPGSVRLIEPFGVGGGPDVVARVLVEPLSVRWGRPVVVENHPGAGSTAAPAVVAKAPPDGSTLLVNTSAHAYSAAVASQLPYDPLRDFVAVAPLTRQAYVLVAGQHAGISGLTDLVATARARPGAMTFGSTGVGTGTHLGTEELNLVTKIRTRHVPAAPGDAIAGVAANVVQGTIDYMMLPISIAAPYLEEGTLVALGVTTAGRSPALPDTPTIAEAGVAGYDFSIWYGVWAPSPTPSEIVEDLASDISSAISEPDVQDWLVDHGMYPMSMTPRAFARFVVDETRRAGRIFDASGITRT